MTDPALDLEHRRRIERVVRHLRTVTDDAPDLGEMADLAGFSPFHFSRLFRRHAGVPPGAFLGALRLERAKRLLLDTDLPVTEVCFEVGYAGPGTFTARFARLVGVSPGAFRRLRETADIAERVAAWQPDGRPDGDRRPTVGGVLDAAPAAATVFVGLYRDGIAAGRPVAGAVLRGPAARAFAFAGVPDGAWRVLAAAVDPPAEAADWLAAAPRLVGSSAVVVVRRGRAAAPVAVALRPPDPLDPPVVVALPVLLGPAGGSPPARGGSRKIGEAVRRPRPVPWVREADSGPPAGTHRVGGCP